MPEGIVALAQGGVRDGARCEIRIIDTSRGGFLCRTLPGVEIVHFH